MTVQVQEQVASREFRGSQNNREAMREWLVYDDTSNTVLTKGQVLAQDDVPKPYNIHPDDPELRAVDPPEVMAIDERNYTWRVRWTYRIIGVPVVGGEREKGEDEIGFIKFELDSSAQFVDAWRTWWPDADNSSGQYDLRENAFVFPQRPGNTLGLDILGKPIDSRGEPTSLESRSVNVTVTVVIAAPLPIGLYSSMVNKRSNNSFLNNFPAGATLYKGNRSRRIATRTFRVVHTFVVDEWFHLRQIVEKVASGQARIATTSDDSVYVGRGWSVTWVQPFPQVADFRVLGF